MREQLEKEFKKQNSDSQENIQKGKFELIESLPSDGFGILNGDDPLQVSYKLKNNVKVKKICKITVIFVHFNE